ncbi:MAG TPA: hypothetical protein VD996_12470 [Chitinophagaceae bacterium]|nr:hypothetical protein [Chitinophagaceae bacterium]
MKKSTKVKLGLFALLLATAFSASAKFFGKQKVSELAYQQGSCAYIERCYDYYAFWIVTNSWCETELVGCQTQDY